MNGPVRLQLSAGLLFGVLAGCASVDPAGDIAALAGYVKDRTGHTVTWSWPGVPGVDTAWDARSPLTARQAIAMALRNSPSVRADLADIAAARADVVQAGLLPNPSLVASLGFGLDSASTMIAAGAMQSLSSLWLLPTRKQAAQAQLQQAVLRVSDNAINLAAEVEKSHRRIVNYQNLLGVLQEQAKIVSRTEEASREKLAAGLGTSLDVNRTRSEVLEIQAEMRDLRTSMDLEKRRLLERLNRADAPAEWAAAPSPPSADAAPDEAAMTALARRQRLDLLAASWSIQAQEARLGEANLSRVSVVEAGADFEREKMSGERAVTRLGPAFRIELPLFDQGQARVAKARAELEKSRIEARAADQRVVREVREAARTLHNAHQQVHAYRTELVPLAQRNVEQAQAAFLGGEVDLLDVLATEREWAKMRGSLLKFEMERDLAWADLTRAVGGALKPVPAPAIVRPTSQKNIPNPHPAAALHKP